MGMVPFGTDEDDPSKIREGPHPPNDSGPLPNAFRYQADSPVREATPSAYLACPTCAGTGYVRTAALAD